ELTGIPTINNFRANDIAKGGQGAPLAPIAEQWIYSGYDLYINLGGIANVSYHNGELITSFDSCPCNQVLNVLAKEKGLEYDSGGNIARRGTIIEEILDESLTTDYMALPAPKSLDNTWVMNDFAPSYLDQKSAVEDRLATMTEFIAIQLSLDIKRMTAARPNDKLTVLVTGGGTHNKFLIESLDMHTGDLIAIVKPDEMTINFKEAILMSFMGYLRMQKVPNTLPSVTGASSPTLGGSLSIPLKA
ncbi:MAG: anhydro-N-acetylmuramic acid kinase, partial [Saprospiraceae bacterium]